MKVRLESNAMLPTNAIKACFYDDNDDDDVENKGMMMMV